MALTDAYCTLGVDREYTLTETTLLNAMDKAHVERAVIATVPRLMAVRNREGNHAILAAAHAHPRRFIPTCTANPWLGREAVAELRRAADAGARILVLNPTTQGFGFGDDLAYPILAVATELEMPVYVHTGPYHFGTPAQLGLAAERFPDLTFIMGHSGSTDFKADAVEIPPQFPNVFAETSLTRPPGAADLVRTLGDDRVIMGTAAPLNDFVSEWRETLRLLPPDDHPGFYGLTLNSILTGGDYNDH